MSASSFYQSVLASGLVPAAPLREIVSVLKKRDVGDASTLDTILYDISCKEPISLERLQCLPRIPQTFKKHIAQKDNTNFNPADAVLDAAEVQHKNHAPEDTQLAEELIRQGFLNRWQAEQLLEERTKFSLGTYRIFDAIGQGAYGYVFLGRSPSRKQYSALKVLPPSKATPKQLRRFRHEIEVQKNLRHLNIVRFFESGQDGNVNYMVHEFMNGGDVRTLLRQENTLPLNTAATIVAQIARGIQYLHENGIVHRDVKPANILLSSNGLAKLADFGLATLIDVRYAFTEENKSKSKVPKGYIAINDSEGGVVDSAIDYGQLDMSIIAKGRVAGTVDYMAPDQLRAPSQPTPAWDIYSLGCTLYQMLTGVVPFPEGNKKEKFQAKLRLDPKDARIYNQAIPFDIADLLRSMLTPHINRRVLSAKTVAERLDAWSPASGWGLKFG